MTAPWRLLEPCKERKPDDIWRCRCGARFEDSRTIRMHLELLGCEKKDLYFECSLHGEEEP